MIIPLCIMTFWSLPMRANIECCTKHLSYLFVFFLFYLVWSVSIFPFLCLFFPRGCPSFICLSLAERLIVSCLSLSLIFLMQFNCRLFPARGRDRQQKKRKKESKKTVIERDSFFSSAFFISVSCNHFSEVKHTSLLLFLERADCGVIALYVRAVKASWHYFAPYSCTPGGLSVCACFALSVFLTFTGTLW